MTSTDNNTPVPAPERDIKSLVMPAIVLFAITVVTVLVLSLLNLVTKDIIAERIMQEKLEKIADIFGVGIELEDLGLKIEAPINDIVLVRSGGHAVGFCVDVTAKGFGGDMRLLVGVNIDNTVKGVRVLSSSETAGIGTKVENDSFLGQFMGLVAGISVGGNDNSIDKIAGATISSKAVTKGINDALDRTLEIDIAAFVEDNIPLPSGEPKDDALDATVSADSESVQPLTPSPDESDTVEPAE